LSNRAIRWIEFNVFLILLSYDSDATIFRLSKIIIDEFNSSLTV